MRTQRRISSGLKRDGLKTVDLKYASWKEPVNSLFSHRGIWRQTHCYLATLSTLFCSFQIRSINVGGFSWKNFQKPSRIKHELFSSSDHYRVSMREGVTLQVSLEVLDKGISCFKKRQPGIQPRVWTQAMCNCNDIIRRRKRLCTEKLAIHAAHLGNHPAHSSHSNCFFKFWKP